MEEAIERIYNHVINIVIDGLEQENIEIAKEEYKRQLKEYILTMESEIKKYKFIINDYEQLYNGILKSEEEKWSNLPIGIKKNKLLKDEALNEIINISSEGYKKAEERLYNNKFTPIEYSEEKIKKLKELRELVKEYNKALSDWYISEGTMDLKYASGQTENTSLRIGHLK